MKIVLSVFLSFVILSVQGQEKSFTVLGKVVDSASRQPLAGASAFCANTTHGAVSNNEGLFFLRLPSGGYDLTVSYTGYDRRLVRISNNQTTPDTLVFELVKQDKTLSEVAVVASNEVADGWAKYGSFFLENFIGTTPNAAQCRLQNPEVLHFFYTKKRNRLKVTAKEDLIIANDALGYTIRYQLDSFNYDYNSNISQFTGFPFFIEKDTTEEARVQFRKNRARTYLGSRLHFMRCFYDSTVTEEGFIVEKLEQNGSSIKSALIQSLYDSLQYVSDSGDVLIGWAGKYRISFKSVLPDKKFLERYNLPLDTRYQITVLDITDGFVIEENGYFYEQYDVVNTGYWAWKKLAELLPYDYDYE